MEFPNHLKAWREFRNLTQTQVEKKFGWPSSRVSNLENGRAVITVDVLLALARHYNCALSDLLSPPPQDLDVVQLSGKVHATNAHKILTELLNLAEAHKNSAKDHENLANKLTKMAADLIALLEESAALDP